MIQIKAINDENHKTLITDKILRNLPGWFGIESALKEYTEQVKGKSFYAAYDYDTPVGFLSIKENNQYSAEIYVMGVLTTYHRQGIGKQLVFHTEKELREKNYRFLMVKTLSGSHPDKNYRRTRGFYTGIGFYPLDELKELWDENNPCLLMVKNI